MKLLSFLACISFVACSSREESNLLASDSVALKSVMCTDSNRESSIESKDGKKARIQFVDDDVVGEFTIDQVQKSQDERFLLNLSSKDAKPFTKLELLVERDRRSRLRATTKGHVGVVIGSASMQCSIVTM